MLVALKVMFHSHKSQSCNCNACGFFGHRTSNGVRIYDATEDDSTRIIFLKFLSQLFTIRILITNTSMRWYEDKEAKCSIYYQLTMHECVLK